MPPTQNRMPARHNSCFHLSTDSAIGDRRDPNGICIYRSFGRRSPLGKLSHQPASRAAGTGPIPPGITQKNVTVSHQTGYLIDCSNTSQHARSHTKVSYRLIACELFMTLTQTSELLRSRELPLVLAFARSSEVAHTIAFICQGWRASHVTKAVFRASWGFVPAVSRRRQGWGGQCSLHM